MSHQELLFQKVQYKNHLRLCVVCRLHDQFVVESPGEKLSLERCRDWIEEAKLLQRVGAVISCGGKGRFRRRMFVATVDAELPRLSWP